MPLIPTCARVIRGEIEPHKNSIGRFLAVKKVGSSIFAGKDRTEREREIPSRSQKSIPRPAEKRKPYERGFFMARGLSGERSRAGCNNMQRTQARGD